MSRHWWWSTKGGKMEVSGVSIEKGKTPLIAIHNGKVAQIFITPHGNRRADFAVGYNIHHCDGSHSSGNILMDRADLARAFGLASGIGHNSDISMLLLPGRGYGHPDAACAGKYFRIGDCLSLPHPGTGLQGDPNISVEITPKIKSAVQALLAFTEAKAA